MSIGVRRRVLRTALSGFLSGDDLWGAIACWEDRYTESPVFPMKFLAEILRTPTLKARRSEIQRARITAAQLPESVLLKDPLAELADYRARSVPEVVARSVRDAAPAPAVPAADGPEPGRPAQTGAAQTPLHAACALYVGRLLEVAEDGDVSGLRREIEEGLGRAPMAGPVRDGLRGWVSGSGEPIPAKARAEDLRRFVNVVYVALCEELGPLAADAALAVAMQSVAVEAPELAGQCRALL